MEKNGFANNCIELSKEICNVGKEFKISIRLNNFQFLATSYTEQTKVSCVKTVSLKKERKLPSGFRHSLERKKAFLLKWKNPPSTLQGPAKDIVMESDDPSPSFHEITPGDITRLDGGEN